MSHSNHYYRMLDQHYADMAARHADSKAKITEAFATLELDAQDLATYQASMVRAKVLRAGCADCEAAREDGLHQYCAVCRGACCACGNGNVTHSGRTRPDGRTEFWCNSCDPEGSAMRRAEEQRRRDVELTGEMPDRKDVEF